MNIVRYGSVYGGKIYIKNSRIWIQMISKINWRLLCPEIHLKKKVMKI